jgi:hypothetical protein
MVKEQYMVVLCSRLNPGSRADYNTMVNSVLFYLLFIHCGAGRMALRQNLLLEKGSGGGGVQRKVTIYIFKFFAVVLRYNLNLDEKKLICAL